MIMRPTLSGNLSDTEVFKLAKLETKFASQDGDLAAGLLPSVLMGRIQGGVDRESEEAVGLGLLDATRQSFDLALSTVTATPSIARDDKEEGSFVSDGVDGHGAGLRANSEVAIGVGRFGGNKVLLRG